MFEKPENKSPEKKLSKLNDEESIEAVLNGRKKIALVQKRYEEAEGLKHIEFLVPIIHFEFVNGRKVVTEIEETKDYVYFHPGDEFSAFRLKKLILNSHEQSRKLKVGDSFESLAATEQYHREVGRTLGYSDEEINEFVEQLIRIGQLKN